MMGFTADQTGLNTYISDSKSGSEYYPQYYLQDYKSLDSNSEYMNVHKNETLSGHIETIVHNKVRFLSMNIKFITDLDMTGSAITNSPTGYTDAVSFMNYCITSGKIEFIEDINDRDTYNTIMFENNKFAIKEESEFKHIYQTGTLKFREVI